MTSCPYCAEPLPAADLEKCPLCGERLVAKAAAGPQGDAVAEYELGRVLGWATRDPEWLSKVLIGAACMLGGFLVLPTLAMLGYKLRVARHQREHPGATPMPAWDDWGALIADGFRLWVATVLPGLAVGLAAGVLLSAVGGVVFLVASSGGGQGGGGPPPGLQLAFMLGVFAFYGFIIVLSLLLMYVMPAIELEYLETESVLSGIRLGALWRRIASDPVEYLVMFVYHYLLQLIGSLGAIACFVGMFFTVPWFLMTDGALLGRYLAKKRQLEQG